ncbi:MAG: Plasmid stabilization system protein [Candidatus Scalindua rubra]|uniref:Plasmid stabilization system protein n=1 Tax=Candidatus Scalindua rubra TaxID=1872076 RepID=A0A1E3X5D9_9BACT|nr:MAG: Plasmid stabilization system protein [Candidatus Scalindua rubra]
MAEYQIEVTEEAKADLYYYTAFERKIVTNEIKVQLTHQPLIETKNKKKLRDNPIATWELRSGKYRIFYEVEQTSKKVAIVAVGHKEHNVLLIRGKEVKI